MNASLSFSVIIPCFNAGRWIRAALESVTRQSYQPHEVIVIDDGSSDDSLAQVQSSGVKVTLLYTKRANAAGARNAGIFVATGSCVAMLDADDVWYPNHLERAAEMLGRSGDVAYMSNLVLINQTGETRAVPNASPIMVPTSGLEAR